MIVCVGVFDAFAYTFCDFCHGGCTVSGQRCYLFRLPFRKMLISDIELGGALFNTRTVCRVFPAGIKKPLARGGVRGLVR